MLAITVFIGGLSIYEVDTYIQDQSENFVSISCDNEGDRINNSLKSMEKSVEIMKSYLIKKVFTLIYIIHNLIQLLNKNSLQNKKNSVYLLYHYFDAGVVQWLVYGLAKARMPVRSRSLAPYVIDLVCNSTSFFIPKPYSIYRPILGLFVLFFVLSFVGLFEVLLRK